MKVDGKVVGTGSFENRPFPAGTHELEVSASGRVTRAERVPVQAGRRIELVIELEATRPHLSTQ